MKIRQGFVSNSSSASFLIATKREFTYSLLRQKLTEYFKEDKKRFEISENIHDYYRNKWGFLSTLNAPHKQSPLMAINRAFSILSDIYWEGVSDTTDPILNPISYREKEFDDEKKDKSHILKMPFYKELKDKGYNYFYRGKGVPDDQVWLFGIRIEDEELALYVAEGY